MIAKKTLKPSLKSLREFAKKRLPDELLIDLDHTRRVPARHRPGHCAVPDKIGHPTAVHSRGVRRVRRRRVRRLPRLRGDGAHRPGRRHRGAGHFPRQRSDHRGRHSRAEEALADAHRRRGPSVRLWGHRARRGQRSGRARRPPPNGSWRTAASSGYRINGSKQWISNGGIADAYTVLANTPGGPSWFVVEKGAPGLQRTTNPKTSTASASATPRRSRSTTCTSMPSRLVGGVEGQGLNQAQAVFGYTRLMVAAFGLGAGWAALDRAIPYSTKRIQAGAPLSEKQGYTHKLIVPNVARLEAGRAFIEETAERIDAGEGSLNTEGAIAKYMCDGSRQPRGRRQHSGAGRIWLHARVHGGEDQARRPHHHDLRRHLRDHGDDHQPRPLAVAPEDARPALSRRRRGNSKRCTRHPEVGAGIAALALHALAEVDGKGPGRPAHPPSAHPAAPGRIDRLRRMRRQPGSPSRPRWLRRAS